MVSCNHPVRGGGECKLSPAHKGHHATVTFSCDGCGKTYRGRPHVSGPDGEYADSLHFCFLCSAPQVVGYA